MVSTGLVQLPRSRSFRLRSVAVALVLPVLAGACGADATTAPVVEQTLDAALVEIAHPSIDYATAAFSGAGVITPKIIPTRCSLDPATVSFVCAPLVGGGLTLNQRYTLSDAAGAKQSAFDAKTTASLSVISTVAGIVVRDRTTLTVDGEQTLVLTGLGTTRHTLNGSSLTLTTLVDSALLDHPPVKTTVKTTLTDLVLPVLAPSVAQPWPLSGTLDIRSLADYGEMLPTGSNTVVSIATITFRGSALVTLSVTVPGGVRTCQVNIALRGLSCS